MDNTDRYMGQLFGKTLEEVAELRQAAWTEQDSQRLRNCKSSPLNNIGKLICFLKAKQTEVNELQLQDWSEEL